MTRSLRLPGLLLVLLFGCAWPAQAGLIDVLEELSGPGPFGRYYPQALFSGLCHPVTDKDNPNLLYSSKRKIGIPDPDQITVTVLNPQAGQSAQSVKTAQSAQPSGNPVPVPAHMPCLYVDVRHLVTQSDDNFPTPSKALLIDAGVTFPIARPIEIGFGAGFVHFKTGDISTPRFMFTPMRFVVKPFLFFPNWETGKKLDFVKYYIKETIIVGRLRGENFGVSNDVFDNKSWKDFVTSGGLIIDLLELFD